jgi:hypothetical protein
MVAPKKADIQISLGIDDKTWTEIRLAATWVFNKLEAHLSCTASQGWTYVNPEIEKKAYKKVIFSLSIGS